ncbi:MAG TPA: ABC transporter ATP-binding protein, partial [Candidatus Paceibacterota bacterium]|nr:ABC transporter ATP-binding protein [Candidatus Paceibacterota bacterium]
MPPRRAFHSFTRDSDAAKQGVKPGTFKRILTFGRSYLWALALFLLVVMLDAAAGVINPLIYRDIINKGIATGNEHLVIELALLAGTVAIADSALTFVQRGLSVRIGQSMLLDMRVRVFNHIQQMSLAFFTRTRTGALVSRLNTDVNGISSAFTDILSSVVSNVVTSVLVLSAMFILSWQLTVIALVLIPIFLIPARYLGRKLQVLTRETYNISSDMNNVMVERFNVAGAQLAKVFGVPEEEEKAYKTQATRQRDITVEISMYSRIFFIALGLTASLAVAVAYGWGGVLTIQHVLDVGTLVAMASYLTRLYGPLTALSNVQIDVLTALVSFDRVFEILDLKPMVQEKPD